MAKVTNKQIIDTVVASMPASEGARLKGLYGAELYSVVADYPQNANPFISTLMNKVVKTMLYSKLFTNDLKQLKQGKLELGESIEQVFVHKASIKNFNDHWDGSNSAEGDLLKAKLPKVDTLYISKNVDKKAAATVKDKDLRKAFVTEYGLSELIAGIIGSINNALEKHEYRAMRDVLCRAIDGVDYNGGTLKLGATFQPMHAVEIADYDTNPSALVEEIRALAGTVKFPHTEFNMAGVETECNKEDLVLITTPRVNAKLDVNVLAHAFNVSNAEVGVRCIEIDSFTCKGQGGAYTSEDDGMEHLDSPLNCTESSIPEGKEVLAVVMDKEFLQVWDTYMTMTSFYNPEQLFTSYFGFREYIMATALFCNAVVFYK